MSVLYYAGGTQWWCKRCKSTVRARKDGSGTCQCVTSPSPWEPVCRKCLHVYRDANHKRGLKRLKMPFSNEKIWRLTLFGWTAEWAYGSCTTDVGKLTETAKRIHKGKRKIAPVAVPEEVQLAALGEIEARSKKGMKPGEFPVERLRRGASRRRG